ncbi:MAG: hypothetical protein WBX38_09700 [Candidatus Sulfotelmatobacter sp.]
MAAGATPAPELKTETKTETNETIETTPATLKQRIVRVLHDIFAGREEYSGWRQ